MQPPAPTPQSPVEQPPPRRGLAAPWVVLIALLAAGIAAGITGVIVHHLDSKAAVPNTPGSASVGGPTLATFQRQELSLLRERQPSGFGVTNAQSISCILPAKWQPGRTGTCYVFHGDNQIGTVDFTVLPNTASGEFYWNSHWLPSP